MIWKEQTNIVIRWPHLELDFYKLIVCIFLTLFVSNAHLFVIVCMTSVGDHESASDDYLCFRDKMDSEPESFDRLRCFFFERPFLRTHLSFLGWWLGAVGTIAGGEECSLIDGNAVTARFCDVGPLTFDNVNYILYAAEKTTCSVRRITFSPSLLFASWSLTIDHGLLCLFVVLVTTLVGIQPATCMYLWRSISFCFMVCEYCLSPVVASYACGSVDGYAYSNGPARLKQPTGIALDSTMNMLYIADFGVATVRQLNLATGYLLTVAGIGLRLPLQIHSFNQLTFVLINRCALGKWRTWNERRPDSCHNVTNGKRRCTLDVRILFVYFLFNHDLLSQLDLCM